jgi:hypothetical protein
MPDRLLQCPFDVKKDALITKYLSGRSFSRKRGVARLNIKMDVRNTASAWAFARMQARQAILAIIGGYRALGYNYRQNGTILDLISHGPYGGIEITF